MFRAQNRATGRVGSAFNEASCREGTSGWFGAGKKLEMNQDGENGATEIWKRKLCPFLSFTPQRKGRGKVDSRRRKAATAEWKYNIKPTPWPGWLWMAEAGREQVPSCGWETFPVS